MDEDMSIANSSKRKRDGLEDSESVKKHKRSDFPITILLSESIDPKLYF